MIRHNNDFIKYTISQINQSVLKTVFKKMKALSKNYYMLQIY